MSLNKLRITLILLSSLSVLTVKAQFFETQAAFFKKDYPCLAYMYKYDASVLRGVVREVFTSTQMIEQVQNNDTYYYLPASLFHPVVMNDEKVMFRIDSVGEDKTIVFVTCVRMSDKSYNPMLMQKIMRERVIAQHEEVEMRCIDYLHTVYAGEVKVKVLQCKGELEQLMKEIKRIETYEPESVSVLDRLRREYAQVSKRCEEQKILLKSLQGTF